MSILDSLVRRLRRHIGDTPYPSTVSAKNPATSLVGGVDYLFNLSIDGSAPIEIDLRPLGRLQSGPLTAYYMQAAIRAADTSVGFKAVRVSYENDEYTITSGATSSEPSVIVTDATANNVAPALRLGEANGGYAKVEPTPRLCDGELEQMILEAFEILSSECPSIPEDIDNTTHAQQLMILYAAWINVLYFDIAQAVYVKDEALGQDKRSGSSVFSNISKLIDQLNTQLEDMKQKCPGFSDVDVVDTVIYDPVTNIRQESQIPRVFPYPLIMQLMKGSDTEVQIEWSEITIPDLKGVSVWWSTTSGLVNRAQMQGLVGQANSGIASHATKSGTYNKPWLTHATVINLPTQVVYFVVTFEDGRGAIQYSDEWSLDLSAGAPAPVLVHQNNLDNKPLEG